MGNKGNILNDKYQVDNTYGTMLDILFFLNHKLTRENANKCDIDRVRHAIKLVKDAMKNL